MEKEFWLERWKMNQIGFHRSAVNPHLEKYFDAHIKGRKKVFLPLCGKSLDLIWLRDRGMNVAGCEISDLAVRSFFNENSIPFQDSVRNSFHLYEGESVQIFCGDFFHLTKENLAGTDCVFDRASLIALPPSMRKNYADQMSRLLVTGTPVLLVSMEYGGGEMSGPPFSVSEDEVYGLFGDTFEINLLETTDILEESPQFRERGLLHLLEKVYAMKRK